MYPSKETLGSDFRNSSSKISLFVTANREFSKHVLFYTEHHKYHTASATQNLYLCDKTMEANSTITVSLHLRILSVYLKSIL